MLEISNRPRRSHPGSNANKNRCRSRTSVRATNGHVRGDDGGHDDHARGDRVRGHDDHARGDRVHGHDDHARGDRVRGHDDHARGDRVHDHDDHARGDRVRGHDLHARDQQKPLATSQGRRSAWQ